MVAGDSISLPDRQGRVLVAGALRTTGEEPGFGLLRFLPDGTLDPTWNLDPALGLTWTEDDGQSLFPTHVVVLSDDSLHVLFRVHATPPDPMYRLVRLGPNGEVLMSNAIPSLPQADTLLIQPDGRILIAHRHGEWDGQEVPPLLRFNPDGSVDDTFSVVLEGEPTGAYVHGMAMDSRGGLVMVGMFDSVNGVSRPGFARILLDEPELAVPTVEVSAHQPRVGEEDVLYLTANVTGYPSPELQWYHNGEPIPGAVHRGLRFEVQTGQDLGSFELRASNEVGEVTEVFPSVTLAFKSPTKGAVDPTFEASYPELPSVQQILPLADGRILVAGGRTVSPQPATRGMLLCLLSDGSPDPDFGDQGVVSGNGFIRRVQQRSDGQILVVGNFSELAGQAVSGIVELDRNGMVLPVEYPMLQPPNVHAAVVTSTGHRILAGEFTSLNGASVPRLIRLTPELEWDAGFVPSLPNPQVVEDLALDAAGRLLIAGAAPVAIARDYVDLANNIDNIPQPVSQNVIGLQRLLEDGTRDPEFDGTRVGVRNIQVQPNGTIIGTPGLIRFDSDGNVVHAMELPRGFDTYQALYTETRNITAWHPLAGFAMIDVLFEGGSPYPRMLRRNTRGRVEASFPLPSGVGTFEAIAFQPDGGLLLALKTDAAQHRLLRFLPDSDLVLQHAVVEQDYLQLFIDTQPHRTYQIRSRTTPNAEEEQFVDEIVGDGYRRVFQVPANDASQFYFFQAAPQP